MQPFYNGCWVVLLSGHIDSRVDACHDPFHRLHAVTYHYCAFRLACLEIRLVTLGLHKQARRLDVRPAATDVLEHETPKVA